MRYSFATHGKINTIPLGSRQNIYPIDTFRRQLLEDWLGQSARSRGVSVSALIEDLETKHRRAIKNRTKGYRRREL